MQQMRWVGTVVALAFAVQVGGGCSSREAEATASGTPSASESQSKHEKKAVKVGQDGDKKMSTKNATFGAGCFWGVESAFADVKGVTDTDVGYCGGKTKNPTYEDVCSDETGHAEVVQVTYDPEKVSYERLLEVFFAIHDPTQVNRQGPDHGSQYRTVVFTHDEEQAATARAYKDKLQKSGKFRQPIATTIEPAQPFWKAEDYHQEYFAKRGMKPTCHIPAPAGS